MPGDNWRNKKNKISARLCREKKRKEREARVAGRPCFSKQNCFFENNPRASGQTKQNNQRQKKIKQYRKRESRERSGFVIFIYFWRKKKYIFQKKLFSEKKYIFRKQGKWGRGGAGAAVFLCFRVFPWRGRWSGAAHAVIRVLCLLLTWFEDLEGAHERLVHRHHSAGVVKLAAIVWRREQGHELPLGKELVSIFDYLVSATYQI